MGCAVLANEPGRLLNLSNRAFIGSGDERLIGSVRAVGEPGTKVEVLAVARGPSLADDLPADYSGSVLADPKLTLVDLATREQEPKGVNVHISYLTSDLFSIGV